MQLSELKWDAAGLVTVVVQDQATGEIRMVAHANREALDATLATGQAHFYSRSRASLWLKGETSGHTIAVSEVWADCDADAVLYLAAPAGPSCHTGRDTCFFRRVTAEGIQDEPHRHGQPTLLALEGALAQRASSTADKSYTKSLLVKGAAKIGEKIREEADEVSVAIAEESDDAVASEAADVLYHLMVGLLLRKVPLRRVQEVLGARFGVSGHVEKASRVKS
ncbi:MAG: bifunctional phosphoribosyl-AMP cyclohydrolase/phosphoribosyl-ATP diphosphatase HisIE [Polyangiales bacterium]|nr:bifunctional phosphoribosyl-AMP cyclohydrolase/phosphoribosyl-ATP diphosphatase HisIE [Myxococcales bacterium]MCB9657570.1 bifunctional phosphoribosyl-AMP cyclohydrolase/phosphoribosyl-ATP diphosphatase HisIE [Sandaracinaceae bacterium]